MCHHFIIFSSFCPLFVFFHRFVLFSPCHIFLKYLDSYIEIFMLLCLHHVLISLSQCSHLINLLSCLNTSFEFSLNLLFKLYYLQQNICGRYRCFPQIINWFHDIYVSDHLVILSKCLFKFEVSRKWERCYAINFYHDFFKIKLLLEFHEIICYLIDSLNLNGNSWRKTF